MVRTALLAVALLVSLVAAAASARACNPKADPGCGHVLAVAGVADIGFCDPKLDPGCN